MSRKVVGLAVVTAIAAGAAIWTALSGSRHSQATTAGQNAPPPPPLDARAAPARSVFTDVTASSGIDFAHQNGATGRWYLCEIMSGGGAFLDYDGDGNLDIYLVQSGVLGQDRPGVTSRLYRNAGDGRFVDVTDASQTGLSGYGMGCAAADYDGDGDIDLYVTRVGPDALLRNEGDGTFSDATAAAGLGDAGYASSAAFLDYDRDGWLDLYVTRYIRFSPEAETPCSDFAGQRDYCNPTAYAQPHHLLYHNIGDGRFEDVSAKAGITAMTGYGLALLCSDFDGDGWIDIYVANDQSPGMLWRNRGDGTFAEEGLLRGAGFNGEGAAIAGMGTAAEDFDGDGDLDLFVTNIRQQSHLFLRNERGMFEDVSPRWGDRAWLFPYTGFGTVMFDQDHDGRLDLFITNGAVMHRPAPISPENPYLEPNQFMRQNESGRFVDSGADLDPAILAPAVSRGLASGDYDNDGDVDLLVCRNNMPPQLLRNECDQGHWLMVDVRDADGRGHVINARVTIEAGGRHWMREVRPHQSYLTTSDPRVHFGLGDARTAERVTVQWPDGVRESWAQVKCDQVLKIVRGTGTQESQP